jgi:glycoprotein endo-alpha-1,2-mannosidase
MSISIECHVFYSQICLHIEPYADRSDVTLRKDLEYVVSQYGNHSAFYRWPSSNLPLYYIYDSYKVSDEMWTSLLAAERPDTIRGTALDGVFIGLAVERTHADQLTRCGFDGFYTYFATDGFTYGSSTRNWEAMSQFAAQKRVLFVPSIGPGYDDTRIRPWNAANTRDRQRGQYYERSFAEAVKVRPPIVSITSFNEWGEGTQIEEAIPKKTDDYTYVDYQPEGADFYLRLTRKWVSRYSL